MFSRFDTIHERYGHQTNGQTDRRTQHNSTCRAYAQRRAANVGFYLVLDFFQITIGAESTVTSSSRRRHLLSDATADDADWQMSSVTSPPPTHRELRHVIVQLMTSRSRAVSLQRRTTLSSELYFNQAPGGTTGFRHPNAGHM